MATRAKAKTLKINDIKREYVPVLSKIPTPNEIRAFQKWIIKMGKEVDLDFLVQTLPQKSNLLQEETGKGTSA